MRVLFVHNRYQVQGGEDRSTEAEAELLERAGAKVDVWAVRNEDVGRLSVLRAGLSAIWSPEAIAETRRRLSKSRYDVMHVQNHFPLISPSIHRVAAAMGVATVQHLRNYRMACANAGFFRDGRECRDCGRSPVPWRGVLRGCYRGSKMASLVPAAMVGVHRAAGTWERDVDAYVAISKHVRDAHVRVGFPADRIHVRYNAVAPRLSPGSPPREDLVFAPSRLSPEKGLSSLVRAWKHVCVPGRLVIAGSGPCEGELRILARDDPSVSFEGQADASRVMDLMSRARAVVNPCLWPEPLGRTPIEAFSAGTPAVVSAAGGLTEIVTDGLDGLVVPPGDETALARALRRMLAGGPDWEAMAAAAARTYEMRFSERVLIPATFTIYAEAARRRAEMMAGRKNSTPTAAKEDLA